MSKDKNMLEKFTGHKNRNHHLKSTYLTYTCTTRLLFLKCKQLELGEGKKT